MWDFMVRGEHSQRNSDFLYGLWKYNPSKNQNIKKNLLESSSESEHKINESFYQFIVLESIEKIPITKLSPFLIIKKKKIETVMTDY